MHKDDLHIFDSTTKKSASLCTLPLMGTVGESTDRYYANLIAIPGTEVVFMDSQKDVSGTTESHYYFINTASGAASCVLRKTDALKTV